MLIDTGTYIGNGGTVAKGLPWTPDVFMCQRHGGLGGAGKDLAWTATGFPTIYAPGAGQNPSSATGVIAIVSNGVEITQDANFELNINGATYAYLALKSEGDIDFGSYVGNQTARDIALGIGTQPSFLWTCKGGAGSNNLRCWARMEGLTFLDSIGSCFPLTSDIKDNIEVWANQITDLAVGQFSLGAVTGSNLTGATYYYLALLPNGKLNYGEQAVLPTDIIDIETSLTLQSLFAFIYTTNLSLGNPGMWRIGGIWRIDAAMPNESDPTAWDREFFSGSGLQVITSFPMTSFTYNAVNDGLPADGYVWWLGLGMPGGGNYGGWF